MRNIYGTALPRLPSFYRGALAGVATKHDKTSILAGALTRPDDILRLRAVEVDTDVLGTFTGDIPRPAGPRQTVVAKARLAIDVAGHRLGVASEGSFGPHPTVGIVTYHTEMVAFVDAETDLVVVGHAAGLAPWTRSTVVTPDDDLTALVSGLDPPHHRLIVRPKDAAEDHLGLGITKGISDPGALRLAVHAAAQHSSTSQVHVETDLRAHMCQLRHPLILQAAQDLAHRLSSRCEACGSPGFGHLATRYGAPCRWCGTPTDSVLTVVDGCPACHHQSEHHPSNAGTGDPATCPSCNP